MFRIFVFALTLIGAPTLSVAQQRVGDITVSAAWSRATPSAAPVAGAYVEIRNDGSAPDRLVSATAAVAGRVEIHEMGVTDGVMRMRALPEGLVIPAGQTVRLRPGSYQSRHRDARLRARRDHRGRVRCWGHRGRRPSGHALNNDGNVRS
jgi:hypothetical protein